MSDEPEEKPVGGRPTNAVRWTMELAAKEFGLDRKTLSIRLRRESIEPNEAGHYSTAQICQAIFGDNEERSRINLNAKKTELCQLQIEAERKERVPIAVVIHHHERALAEIVMLLRGVRGRIIDDLTVSDILSAFRGIPAKIRA